MLGRWAFIRHRGSDDAWLWQRFGPDGRLEHTSKPFSTYGKVLRDALAHGFDAYRHDYSVDLPHGRMHFPPGRDPEFSSHPPTLDTPRSAINERRADPELEPPTQ